MPIQPYAVLRVLDDAIKTIKQKLKPLHIRTWKMKKMELSKLLFPHDMALVAGSKKTDEYSMKN